MVLNKFQDSDCGMVIDTLDYASQVIAPDRKTWFFTIMVVWKIG